MTMLKRLFNGRSTLKNIATLVSGTIAAQLIVIAAQPVLRRIIDPEFFGVFAVYMSVVGVVVTVISLRYDMAVVLPEKDETARNIVLGGVLINATVSLLIFLFLFVFQKQVQVWLAVAAKYYFWFYLLPFSVFFAGSYRLFNNWLIRKKQFRKSSENKVVRRGSEAGVQLLGGFLSRPIGLFVGELFGSVANLLAGIRQSVRTGFHFNRISFRQINQDLLTYKHFPLYNTLPVLLNGAALYLPIVLINRLFSETITAQYDLTRQMLGLSLALISAAISQVYLQKLADQRNLKQKLWPDILKAVKVLTVLSLLGILVIQLFGEWLFGSIFGVDYAVSGFYAKILVVSFGVRFVVTPLSIAFISLERLKLNALWQFLYFLAILSLFSLQNVSIEDFLVRYVFIDLIAYILYFVMIVYIVKQHDTKIAMDDKTNTKP